MLPSSKTFNQQYLTTKALLPLRRLPSWQLRQCHRIIAPSLSFTNGVTKRGREGAISSAFYIAASSVDSVTYWLETGNRERQLQESPSELVIATLSSRVAWASSLWACQERAVGAVLPSSKTFTHQFYNKSSVFSYFQPELEEIPRASSEWKDFLMLIRLT